MMMFAALHIETTANGEWKIGGDAVARRYRAEELIDVPLVDLAALGERELTSAQERFRNAARRLAPGVDPQTTWLTIRRHHPKRGEVVAAAQAVVDSLTRFIATKNLAVVPNGERVMVKPAQPFSLGFASMHASPDRPPSNTPSAMCRRRVRDAVSPPNR